MSEVMDRIRQAAAKAAAGPLAGDRERPQFERVAAQSPFPPEAGREDYIERFRTELEALSAKVYGPSDVGGAAEQVARLILTQVSAPAQLLSWAESEIECPELGGRLRQLGIEMVAGQVPNDESHQDVLEKMAAMEVGLTGAIAGLADTGSILVASGSGRSRIASLLPPVHIALLPVERIYPTMHDWLVSGGADLVAKTANVVAITGSSRTSDIELQLTLGMHGPKELHVVLVQ